MRRASIVLALCLAAACSRVSGSQSPEDTGPRPPAALAERYGGCAWGEVRQSGVSVWSFACEGGETLKADPNLPGFQIEHAQRGGVRRLPVIRIFSKAPEAPIESVTPTLRAASPGGEACELEPIEAMPGMYQLMPVASARVVYEEYIRGDAEGPSAPCGPLGPIDGGLHLVFVVPGAADKVVTVDGGSEVRPFDLNTIAAGR